MAKQGQGHSQGHSQSGAQKIRIRLKAYDHRLIDGRDAVRFLVAIKEMIEYPAKILLQI